MRLDAESGRSQEGPRAGERRLRRDRRGRCGGCERRGKDVPKGVVRIGRPSISAILERGGARLSRAVVDAGTHDRESATSIRALRTTHDRLPLAYCKLANGMRSRSLDDDAHGFGTILESGTGHTAPLANTKEDEDTRGTISAVGKGRKGKAGDWMQRWADQPLCCGDCVPVVCWNARGS